MPTLFLTLFILMDRTGLRFADLAVYAYQTTDPIGKSYARVAPMLYRNDVPYVLLDVSQLCPHA